MRDVRLLDQRPSLEAGILLSPVADHKRPAMAEQTHVVGPLFHARRGRIPRPTHVPGLDFGVDPGDARVELVARRRKGDEALALTAGRERIGDAHLHHGDVPQEGAHQTHTDALCHSPFLVGAEGRGQEVEDPEGDAGGVEGDCEEGPQSLDGLVGQDRGHGLLRWDGRGRMWWNWRIDDQKRSRHVGKSPR